MSSNNSGNIQFLHFDSVNGNYTDDPFNVSFVIQSGCIKNIKRLYLKSVEIPVGFYNVRSAIQSTFSINGAYFTIDVGNYSDINALLTTINYYTEPFGYSFSLNIQNNDQINSDNVSTILLDSSFLLTTMLGFKPGQYVEVPFNGVGITAAGPYNLNYDNYLNMYIGNVPNPGIQANTSLCTFKIPLNASNGVVYYLSENTGFSQYVDFSNSNYITTILTVQVLSLIHI